MPESPAEGSLKAPERHPLEWKQKDFYDKDLLLEEMERVFDICHGCRRCFSLCNAFPTLFDAIDESPTGELDSVDKGVYWQVVDHCYLCDLCFMTKCPYVPPHPFNVDFPHLMLRGKAVKFKEGKVKVRDKLITRTDLVGRFAGIPVVVEIVNRSEKAKPVRRLMDKALGIHPQAWLPPYHADTLHKRFRKRPRKPLEARPGERTRGKVVLFGTCYGEYNEPDIAMDLVRVFEHNGIPVELAESRCCGMPKLEIGDFETVERLKDFNIPRLAKWVEEGFDIVAPVPSCALMFRQELPLLFPEEEGVKKVAKAMYDPFEYLMLRDQEGLLNTDFKVPLGKVVHHAACHMRVQNVGLKSRELLSRVPGTAIEAVERCSGHDGTYAMKSEFHDIAMKIGRPVFRKVESASPDYYTSDCPIAGHQIETGLHDGSHPTHPLTLLRIAYGLEETS